MSKIVVHIIMIVLGLKPTSVPALIVRAKAIVNAMSAAPTMFPSPTPTLLQAEAEITSLINAQTAFKDHTGTATDRDDKKKIVIASMHSLAGYVQQLASANPAQASVIASAASMSVRKAPLAHHKAPLTVKQTVSGSVHVIAKATKGARSNYWQYSFDGGKTWIDLPPTTQANMMIHNLTPGTTVTYRQRVITKAGLGDWSQPISALVT